MSEKGTDRSAQARQERAEAQTESRVMEDLVNALLAEGMLDGYDRVTLVSPDEWRELIRIDGALAAADRLFGPHAKAHVYRWRANSGDGRAAELVFPVFPAVVQAYRLVANAGVYELATGAEGGAVPRKIGPLELMTRTLDLHEGNQEVDPDSAKRLLDMIAQTLQQTAWTLENELTGDVLPGQDASSSLLALERKAAFRDRPFHPVAKVKMGLAEADYRRYSPEFGGGITLRWMAVSRKHIVAGEGARDAEPARLLLAEEEEARVREEMEKRGLAADDYVPLPVHPWQMTGLAEHLREEMAAGVCVPLAAEAGVYHATSSLRSLMPESGEGLHVKLPLGLHSLGGLRYLSAIKLMNGGRAERLMRSALERDAELGRRLFLCDETAWWAYLPESRDLFAEAPRHLSAMLRQYPPELAADEGVRLVPMSALAVFGSSEGGHVFDEWLRSRGSRDRSGRRPAVRGSDACFLHGRPAPVPSGHDARGARTELRTGRGARAGEGTAAPRSRRAARARALAVGKRSCRPGVPAAAELSELPVPRRSRQAAFLFPDAGHSGERLRRSRQSVPLLRHPGKAAMAGAARDVGAGGRFGRADGRGATDR